MANPFTNIETFLQNLVRGVNSVATAIANATPGVPSPSTGAAGDYINVNSSASGYQFRTPAEVLSDIGGLPAAIIPTPATGNELSMIRVDAAGTAYETRTPAQVLTDIGGQSSGSTGTNTATLAVSTTLTAAQSGTTFRTDGFTAAGTITLPANAAGLNFVIYGNPSYAITVTAPAGSIVLPDVTAATSYVLPTSNFDAIFLLADGTNWRAHTIGRNVVAPAVNANEAVQRGQVLSGISVGAVAGANGTTISATTGTVTAPCNGMFFIYANGVAQQTNNSSPSISASGGAVTSIQQVAYGNGFHASGVLNVASGTSSNFTASYSNGTSGSMTISIAVLFVPVP